MFKKRYILKVVSLWLMSNNRVSLFHHGMDNPRLETTFNWMSSKKLNWIDKSLFNCINLCKWELFHEIWKMFICIMFSSTCRWKKWNINKLFFHYFFQDESVLKGRMHYIIDLDQYLLIFSKLIIFYLVNNLVYLEVTQYVGANYLIFGLAKSDTT